MTPSTAVQTRDFMLIIDDDFINREIIKNIFPTGFSFLEAENGLEGLHLIEQHSHEIRVILLDVQMPLMDGMTLLNLLHDRGIPGEIPIFIITSNDELDIARQAYDMGVMGVINKPVVPFIVDRRVQIVVELFKARRMLNDKVRHQEQTIQENVATIDTLHRKTLEAMASAIEFRDVESGEHTNRIYDITRLILQKTEMGAGFTQDEIENMAIGSIMHDVGKIAISDMILNKPGRLTRDEFEIMKLHTVKGGELMEQLIESHDHPSYRYALDIARHHHERWDGNGYPDGLKENDITVWSQVVSIADVYDALVSPRVYKKEYTPDQAVEMILNNQCGVFNPKLLSCFLEVEGELRSLYQTGKDTGVPASAPTERQPHAPLPAPSDKDPMDAILLSAAIQQFYNTIIFANLTRNTFYIPDNERSQSHCSDKEGVFDDLIESGAQSIPLSHRQAFISAFSRQSLMEAYARGKTSVSLDHPQYMDDGTIMAVSTHVLLMEDPRNGNIRNITLIRYAQGKK